MITRLKLENFKNFKNAELHLGSLTTLIGSNAAGKSNLRDAFRFLHGIGRGYFIPEIIGEKYVEGGVLQWRGIRGGINEITYGGSEDFRLTVSLDLGKELRVEDIPGAVEYSIRVAPNQDYESMVLDESLRVDGRTIYTHPNAVVQDDDLNFAGRSADGGAKHNLSAPMIFNQDQPLLAQIDEDVVEFENPRSYDYRIVHETRLALQSMRFFDLSVDALRTPSTPGQTILGDRGENLSSLLQAIAKDTKRKQALISWLRELTPMDVANLRFISDQTGRVLVNLVETSGRQISAYSASDGTLRFLALLAVLLAPDLQGDRQRSAATQLYFFEELENGLHPARLYLLLQLIEQEMARQNIQVVSTTHSPQYLRFLSEQSRESASLIYRLSDSAEGRIRRIVDIPDVERILGRQDLGRLHESGWFEDAMSFLEDPHPAPE